MKIIFMGTPDFAVSTVEGLYNAGHEIVLVVTQPDKPKGRSGKLAPSAVKTWALSHEIPIYQPERIKDSEAIEYISGFDAALGVVAAFGQILPRAVLDIPTYGCINVHASLLPKYRGASPIQWAILSGDDKTGVTIMQMGEGLDDGDIIYTKEYILRGDETGGELFDILASLGAKAICEAAVLIERGEVKRIKQDESQATHVGMISKSLGLIDWSFDANKIDRYVRGLNPWPSAYTSYKGKTLKVWRSHVVEDANALGEDISSYKPSQVCIANKHCLYVMTGDGILSLDEVQLEGKKRMEIGTFLMGSKILPGEELG